MKYKREYGLVSIVISNYNNENYIQDCLDSLLNQTYKDIELIVINDASTDDSINAINQWIEKNKDSFIRENYITVVNMPRNVGFSGAVTVGMYLAKGEFVAMHDGDDRSNETRIEKQVGFLRNNPDIYSVGSDYSVFNDADPTPVKVLNTISFGSDKIKDIYYKGGHCICFGSLLFRGVVFDEVGGLSRKMDLVEDYEFIAKIIHLGVENLNDTLYYYREHTKQRSKDLFLKREVPIDIHDYKVLFVLDSLGIGGTETHVLALVSELIQRGIKVVILAARGELYDEFDKLGCKIYNIDFPLTIVNESTSKMSLENQIISIINDEDINIVHAHQSPSGALSIDVCKKLNIPCVFTIHGLYYQDIVYDKLKSATEVISVSQPVYDWLLEYGVASTVIPNSLNFEAFKIPSGNLDIRESLNIPKDSMLILYCSRIAWGKANVASNLIRVCRDLRKLENLNLHLLIVGDGPDFNRIASSAKMANLVVGEDFIHLLGGQTNVKDYYISCDCVVGTGRVVIEALACNKPIIAAGNHGYFGILDESNLEKSWSVYFGDHQSIKSNNASYLYKDLKDLYHNRLSLSSQLESLTMWARNKFDISINTNYVLDIYKRSFEKINL